MSSERLIQTKQMRSGCPSIRHSSNIPTFRTAKFANLDRYAGSSLESRNPNLPPGQVRSGGLGLSEDGCARKVGFALHYDEA